MNKKKYIFTGAGIIVVLILSSGGIYHFYPNAVNNLFTQGADANDVITLDSSQINNASSEDILSPSDDSSSPVSIIAKKTLSKRSLSAASSPLGNGESVTLPSDIENAPEQGVDANENDPSDATDSVMAIASNVSSSENDSVSTIVPAAQCSFPDTAPSTTKEIVFNEIAWMGSPSSSNAEWIEIKNNSSSDINLSGWEIMDESEKIKIVFAEGDTISAEGLFLLSRSGAASTSANVVHGEIYSGDLVNTGDVLVLVNPQCVVSDYLDASQGWPGGNNATKQTLERNADAIGWHTSAAPGGTPDAENSAGPPPAQYKITIAFQGDAPGSITSTPAGLVCGASCTGSFASGTTVTLSPLPGADSKFNGWSGSCYGEIMCSLVITGPTSMTADFRSTISIPSSVPVTSSDSSSGTPANTTSTASSSTIDSASSSSSSSEASESILIEAVQIAGASSSDDFVKLYNPTASVIDMSGWKLHKKSQTGTDYSLKQFPAGSTIARGQTFMWANSSNGFSETVDANVSSTETLSADNSVALMDATGTVIDAVAWGTGTNQYGEGSPYPTNPEANQILVRQTTNGIMINTNNNASDFTLQ